MDDTKKVEEIRRILEDPFIGHDKLTPQHRLIARLAAQGHKGIGISNEMKISESGVRTTLGRIKERTGLDKLGLVRDMVKRIQDIIDA